MKVALSASSDDCPAAMAPLLRTCDLIYTTQGEKLEKLHKDFPQADIRVIPDQGPDLVDFLRERHKHDEVVTFSDLMTLRNEWWPRKGADRDGFLRSQLPEEKNGMPSLVVTEQSWVIPCCDCGRVALVVICKAFPCDHRDVLRSAQKQAQEPNYALSGWGMYRGKWVCTDCIKQRFEASREQGLVQSGTADDE